MRAFFLAVFFLIAAKAYPDNFTLLNPNWTIVKNSQFFSFSAEFNFKQGNDSDGKVVRSGLFCPRYYYDLYDSQNAFAARGITRAFSLGFFLPWAMEIDVYDENAYVGKIDGKIFTKARAKFVFYDSYGNEAGFAYLNTEASDFVIFSTLDESKVLAEFKGEAFGDVSIWKMNFTQTQLKVDPRMLKIFGAFVADYHTAFLPPPDVVNNYYFYNNHGTD